MVSQLNTALCILRRKQVEARTGLPRSTLYQLIAEGGFPKPVRLASRSVGWLETDINEWILSRCEAAREEA